MNYKNFRKYMKIIPFLRDKVVSMGRDYPLYRFYNQIIDKINKLSFEQYERFQIQFQKENLQPIPVYIDKRK